MNTSGIEGGIEVFGTASGSLNIGNTKQIVSLIVSHNSRLRCLLKNYNSIAKEQKHSVIHRLMNCAILKLVLKSNGSNSVKFEITLENDGKIGEDEDKEGNIYYTKDKANKSKAGKYDTGEFKDLKGEINTENIAKIGLDKIIFESIMQNPDIEYVFYMIRHGQGTHNIPKGLGKKWQQLTIPDTNLTNEGKKQAVAAGRYLREIIDKNHKIFTSGNTLQLQSSNKPEPDPKEYLHLFVSDLRRTHQTMVNLIQGIKEGPLVLDINQKIDQITNIPVPLQTIVLPCAHELDFIEEDGICDANQPSMQKLTGENRTCCITYDSKKAEYPTNPACRLKGNEDIKCVFLYLEDIPKNILNRLNIDWEYYKNFYIKDFSDRAFRYMSSTGPNCSNTSMIAHAIAIINDKTLPYVKTEIPLKPRKTLRSRLSKIFTRKQTQKTPTLEKSAYSGHGFVGNYVNMLLNLK